MIRYNKNQMVLLILFLCVAVLMSTAGCSKAGEPVVYAAESVHPQLVEANTTFAFNLFHALQNETPGDNIFISPASVSLALAMTYNGAAGDTAAAMAKTLQIQDMSLDDLNAAFGDLRTILQNPDPKVELSIANSLWARQGVEFYEEFLDRNLRYFGAEVTSLNFDLPDATDTINRWVEQQTNDKIKDLIEPPIHPDTILFLINAIYFQADWTEPFDPEKTRDVAFHLSDGNVKEHPVMFREGEFNYLDGDGFQAVSIPYGETGRLSMYIFLPVPEQTLENFYQQLTPDNWNHWLTSFKETEGSVGLPRFQYEYESSLKDVLKAMGMDVAFNEAAADFSGMRPTPPRLFIAEVKHKSFIDVNEEGTEAAAATSVEIRTESAPIDWFSMVMDRPFFFSIVDNKTDSILFMGSVNDPE